MTIEAVPGESEFVFESENTAEALPSWYPADVSAFTDFHNENAPRVVDDADMFTDAQEKELTSRINELIGKYGQDLVIFTDNSTYHLSRGVYAADFYQFNGYGKGSDYSGSVLFISMEPGNRGWWTAARGNVRTYYTEENINSIDDRLEPYMVNGQYYEGMLNYLESIDILYEKGSIPREKQNGKAAVLGGLLAAISAALSGAMRNGVLKSKMKTVQKAEKAAGYFVDNSLNLRYSNNIYLYSNVVRTQHVDPDRGSSGGGSSYSGNYSSSGGGSFSGGGRSF